jgi:hypothetical protein
MCQGGFEGFIEKERKRRIKGIRRGNRKGETPQA